MPSQLMVRFIPGADENAIRQVVESLSARVLHSYGRSAQLKLIELPENLPVQRASWLLSQMLEVDIVEPNYIYEVTNTPDDTDFASLWGLHNAGQTGGTPDVDINAPEAWKVTTGNRDVIIGIIDTGIDYAHEDLAANVWVNVGEIEDNFIDDDGNGWVDDVYGISAIYAETTPHPEDLNGHGSHVAGVIAAQGNNATGVTGVMWEASIVSCQAFSAAGSGPLSAIIECMEYFTALKDSGVDIVATNNSWGSYFYSQILYDAISAHEQRDILFVAAAGNDGEDIDALPHYPAGYDHDAILSVAAIDHTGELAGFTNYGASGVDIAAPGVSIYSTTISGNYEYKSGTSMATPFVTGVAGLLAGKHSYLNAAELKQHILDTGMELPGLAGRTQSGKLVRADIPILDLDADGMDDDWEDRHNLDATSSGDANMDADSDGLTNLEEYVAGTDPNVSDSDADGLSDADEVQIYLTDPLSADTDGDTLSDFDEVVTYGTNPLLADTDDDGQSDDEELITPGMDPLVADTDGDGMDDGWELLNGLDPQDTTDANADADGDGLSNAEEFTAGSDPQAVDTDDDGLSDFVELNATGTDPANADTDADRMPDGWEDTFGLDPLEPADAALDPDGDNYSSYSEYRVQTNPLDGLSAPEVPIWGTRRGNAASTAHVKIETDDTDFVQRWVVEFETGGFSTSYLAVAGDKIHMSTGFDSEEYADFAFSLADGEPLWEILNQSADRPGPPAVDAGIAYTVAVNFGRPSILRAFDAETAVERFSREIDKEDVSEFVVPDGGAVFVSARDSIMSFDAVTGDLNWDTQVTDGDNYSIQPAVDDQHVADFSAGTFSVLDRDTGAIVFQDESSFCSSGDVILANADTAVVTSRVCLTVYDLQSQSMIWEQIREGEVRGVTTDEKTIFVADYTGVTAVNRSDGAEIWQWSSPEWADRGIASTLNHVFVSTATETFALDAETGEEVWSYPFGGNLAISDEGALIIGVTGDAVVAITLTGDRDFDGAPDWWEDFHQFDKLNAADAAADADGDALTNLQEFELRTDPRTADSDADGLDDGYELNVSFSNPHVADTDHDGLSDGDEILTYFTDPGDIDSDRDSYTDFDEAVSWGSNSLDAFDVPDLIQSMAESFEQGLPANWVIPSEAAAGWEISAEDASDGNVGLRAQQAVCCDLIAIDLIGDFNAGDLYFDVKKADNSSADYVLVYLDDVLAYRIGDLEWTTYRIHIPRGSHVVRFEFEGWNNDLTNPVQTAWIDNVRFEIPRQFAGDQKNFLVTEDNRLFEIDLDKSEVRAARLFPDAIEFSDLVVTADHKVALEDAPNLTIFDPATGFDFSTYHRGWSTAGNNAIVATERHILISDFAGLKGVRRMDLHGNFVDHLHIGTYFDDMAIGPDGYVYGSLQGAFRVSDPRVLKMHPDTLEVVKTIYLELGSTGLSMTVGPDERIYIGDVWCPSCVRPIVEYDNDGNLLRVVFPYDHIVDYTGSAKQDLDMHRYGVIIAGTFSEDVVFADLDRMRFDYMTPSDSSYYRGYSRIAIVRKTGLDADADGMPDWWERVHRLQPEIPGDALADTDGDGLSNLAEFAADTEPRAADTDGDGLNDGDEVLSWLSNPVLVDSDEDGIVDGDETGAFGTDPLVADSDGDGLIDGEEVNSYGTSPTAFDSDGDGLGDGWEIDAGLDPLTASDALLDSDGDGLGNAEENQLGTDANLVDSDFDELSDFEEVRSAGTDPTNPDSDADRIWDGWEVEFGLNPVSSSDASADFDLDGFDNLTEFYAGTSPIDAASFPVTEAWSTYRGGASHTGLVRRTLDPASFTDYWSLDLTPDSRVGLQAAVSGNGLVWVTTKNNYWTSPLTALSASDGGILWQHDFQSYSAISPPALHQGSIFLQTSRPGEIWRLDSTTGVAEPPVTFNEQFFYYKAMTPFDEAVYAQSGTYGGLSSFDSATLQENWWIRLPQVEDFTPAADADFVYLYRPFDGFGEGADARLELLHRSNAAVEMVLEDPEYSWTPFFIKSAPVLTGKGSVIVSFLGRLARFDLNRREISWRVYGGYTGTPAFANGVLYAVDSGELVAIDEATGAELWRWVPPSYLISEVVATLTHVIVASRAQTYAVNLSTQTMDWSYPAGGNLTLGNDQMLYIATRFGELHAVATFGDADRDGISDQWESLHGFDSSNPADASLDADGDGLTNKREFDVQSDPNTADSDGDGITDGDEVQVHRSSPHVVDTDGDGLADGFEVSLYASDPTAADSDDDSLSDGEEVSLYATSPTLADTDGDGYLDGQEVKLGSDPGSSASTPPRLGTVQVSFESGEIPAFMDSDILATRGWDVAAVEGGHGDFVLRAADTRYYETVALDWTGNFDAGEVHFDQLILAGNRDDVIRFLIDGEEVASGGGQYWSTSRQQLDQGVHTLRWEFYHGELSNDRRVVAMLDNIRVIKDGEDIDSDNDGMGDTWETENGLDMNDPSDADEDPDADGLSNLGEHDAGSDPFDADTDFDGMPDGWEVQNGLNPTLAADRDSDADGDGLRAQREYDAGTNPNDSDTDDDGMPDGWEVANNLNPLVNDAGLDPDGDGVSNLNEYIQGTNPNLPPVSNPPPPPSSGGGGGGSTGTLFVLLLFGFALRRRTVIS